MSKIVAINQLNPLAGSPNLNFKVMEAAIVANRAAGAVLSIFPEDFLHGVVRDRAELERAGERFDHWVHRFAILAKRHSIDTIPGSMPKLYHGKIYNTTVYIDKTGKILTTYAKNNLWLSERGDFSPSLEPPVVFDSVLGKTAIIICWDLFDHRLFEAAVKQGAQWVINVAFWSVNQSKDLAAERGVASRSYRGFSDSKMLDVVIQARAAEYNIGLLFCNFAGKHEYVGRTGPQVAYSANRSQLVTPFMTVDYKLSNRREDTLLCVVGDISQRTKDFDTCYSRRPDVVCSYPWVTTDVLA